MNNCNVPRNPKDVKHISRHKNIMMSCRKLQASAKIIMHSENIFIFWYCTFHVSWHIHIWFMNEQYFSHLENLYLLGSNAIRFPASFLHLYGISVNSQLTINDSTFGINLTNCRFHMKSQTNWIIQSDLRLTACVTFSQLASNWLSISMRSRATFLVASTRDTVK